MWNAGWLSDFQCVGLVEFDSIDLDEHKRICSLSGEKKNTELNLEHAELEISTE